MKLIINNSTSQIIGLTVTQYKELRELLSYSAGSRYFSGSNRPNKRYLLGKSGSFPTGLLGIVRGWASVDDHDVFDYRKPPSRLERPPILRKAPAPYPEQSEAVDECEMRERGIVAAPTGLGKSFIIALLIARMQVKTLVVVPGLELKRQLTASLLEAFGSLENITVENVDALDPKKLAAGYGMLIIDEFHHAAAATYRKLNKYAWSGIYYRFGFTATPFRSNDNEKLLLESVLSTTIYKIEYSDAVANKRIVPVEAYYYDLPKTPLKGSPDSWPAVYSELVVNNEVRNKMIARLVNVLESSTLTLVKEIRHGEILSELTGVPFANGEEGNTRVRILEFNLREIKSLIGTTGILGEGIDTKPAEWIILAAGGKSKNALMQQIGRGVRIYPGKESCKVILFRDKSHPWLLRHFNACIKVLKEEYGVKPVRLEMV